MFISKQILCAFLIFFTVLNTGFAQKSYQKTGNVNNYQKGIFAFEQGEYMLSENYFSKISDTQKKEQKLFFYQLLNNVYLERKNAVKNVAYFLDQNPYSIYGNDLKLAMANSFFNKKQTALALSWYKKVDAKFLSNEQELNYNYRLAFAYYNQQNFAKAKQYLFPLAKEGVYKNEANYYLANIAIQQKEYNTALSYLDKINNAKKFDRDIAYQKLIIYFKQKKYQKVTQNSKLVLKKALNSRKSELAKVIGESYFYLGDFETALSFLKLYKGKRNKLSATDNYFLGYTYYSLNQYQNAILYFNKITDEQNAIAQNAHYHLADCYLVLNKKLEALNAFKNASEINFDAEIQQDAFLNYVKLSYEIGNPYESSSKLLQAFVDKYPNAKETGEIKSLIVNAYLLAKDYTGVLTYYNEHKLLKDQWYYTAVLEQGLVFFSNYRFNDALPLLEKANQNQLTNNQKSRAVFWKAETFVALNQLEDASLAYQTFLNSFSVSNTLYSDTLYGYAYCLYQQKKYKEALKYFIQFVDVTKDETKKLNAILRIGDCNYVTKKYWPALESYNVIVNKKANESDYALYQKALSYGFLGRHEDKIKFLKEIVKDFPKSAYADKSLYQLGNLYNNRNQSKLALQAYDNLIDHYNKSSLIAKTRLKKGLIYYNIEENVTALKILKDIVKDYPGTAEAVQAVKVAQQVYKELDRVEDYASWVKNLEFVNITESDLDRTMFEAVESRYLQNNLKEVVTSAKKYLINYPKGIYVLTVNFYLAQAYHHTEQPLKAIVHYQYVLAQNNNEFVEVSSNTLAQIYMQNNQWDNAFPLLNKIEHDAVSESNITFAQSNLMRYYAQQKTHPKVLFYVSKVISNSKSNTLAVNDAYLYGARSAVELKNYDLAKRYYQKLEIIGSGKVLAEANYYKALWLFQDKDYVKSNEQVQILASKYQQYKYFGVKGLLLMAQNYHALKDNFQAIFILNNVIENAQEYPDVIKKGELLLQKYESKVKTENK